MVNYSARDREVTAAVVLRSDRPKCAVGSADWGLQVKGEDKCLGFVRPNVSWEVEEMRQCAGICMEDWGVCEQLQPLRGEFDLYIAKEQTQLLPDTGYTKGWWLEGFHQVNVRQDQHHGELPGGDSPKVESTRSADTIGRRVACASHILKAADEEWYTEAVSEVLHDRK